VGTDEAMPFHTLYFCGMAKAVPFLTTTPVSADESRLLARMKPRIECTLSFILR
jgi:hypothetical protein